MLFGSRFWTVFEPLLDVFWWCFAALGKEKHRIKIQRFCALRNCNMVKTAQIQLFLLGTGTKTLQIPWFWLPEAKNIANTVVLGFRGAENIGLYHDFCSDGFKNMRKHRLAIFRGPQKCENKLCCKNNSNNSSSSNNNNKKKKNKKNKHKNSTKRCVVRWLQAAQEHHTVLCACTHAQST